MAELRMMQQNQQQLQQSLIALADTLKTVTGRLDEQAATSRKALADQRLLIEGMTDTVRMLREKSDDTNVRLSSITQELESIRQTIASHAAAGGRGDARRPIRPPTRRRRRAASGVRAGAAGRRRRRPTSRRSAPTTRPTPTTPPVSTTWRSSDSRRS